MSANLGQLAERKVTLTEGQLASLFERASAYAAANAGTLQGGQTQEQRVNDGPVASFPSSFNATPNPTEDMLLPKFPNATQQQLNQQQHNNFFDLDALLNPMPHIQETGTSSSTLLPQRTSNPPQMPFFAQKFVRYGSVVKFLRPNYPNGIQLRELWKTISAGGRSQDEDPDIRHDLLSVADSWSGRARGRLIAIEMSAVVHFEGLMVKGKKGGLHYGIKFADKDPFYTHERPQREWIEESAKFTPASFL